MSKRRFDLTGLPMRWPTSRHIAWLYQRGRAAGLAVELHKSKVRLFFVSERRERASFLRFADWIAAAAAEVRKRAGEEKKA